MARSITIRALNPGAAIISGDDVRPVIRITSGTITLEGLRVTGGRFQSATSYTGAGGVFISGAESIVTLTSCDIYSNHGEGPYRSARQGIAGGVYVYQSSQVTLNDCNIYSNIGKMGYAAGGLNVEGNPVVVLSNCHIYDNYGEQQWGWGSVAGGARVTSGTVTFLSCTIHSNEARGFSRGISDGGGVWTGSGSVSFYWCNFHSNAGSDPNNECQGSPNNVYASSSNVVCIFGFTMDVCGTNSGTISTCAAPAPPSAPS